MSRIRKVSASQQKAVNKYVKANYESFTIRSHIGLKERVRSYASRLGESMNQYVLRAVREQMAREDAAEMNRMLYGGNPKEKHTYHIMWEDRPVTDVTLSNDHKEITYTLFMPAGCNQPFCAGRLDLERFYRFLKDRCYEDNRGDLPEILEEAGMSSNNPWEWVRLTHGVTWHDHIWIRFDEEEISWEEVKLRD